MGGIRKGGLRRLAVALGLCGVLLYASLIPRHFVSEFVGTLIGAELGTSVMCHAGDGPAAPGDSKDRPKCPFCQGYASLQLTTLEGGIVFVIAPPPAGDFLLARNHVEIRRASVAPHNRGPPPIPV